MSSFSKKAAAFFVFTFIVAASFTPVLAQVGFHSAGLGFGWYKPSMNYWNDQSQVAVWESQFNGSFMGEAHVAMNILPQLRTRFEIGFWRESVKQADTPIGIDTGNEEISISFMPLSATLLIDLPISSLHGMTSYIGGGGAGVNIRKTYISSPNNGAFKFQTVSGFTYTYHFVLGMQKTLAPGLGFGIEYRQVFGSYGQLVQDNTGTITREDVSMSGPQIIFSWVYLFNQL